MLLSLCGGWGLQSHFCVQPNNCVVVGVVTTRPPFDQVATMNAMQHETFLITLKILLKIP